jgi:hypothetical protein
LYSSFFAYSTNRDWVDCCDISHPDFEKVIHWMMHEQNTTTTVPPTLPPVDTTQPLEEEFIRSTGKFTYIRTTPTADGAIVGQIPAEGVLAIVYPEQEGSLWRRVEIGEVQGYSHFGYISREKPPSIEIRITLNAGQVSALQAQLKTP